MSYLASRPALSRRALLVRSAQILAITAAASICAAPLHAQTTRTLKIGYILSKDSQLGAGAQAFADEVAKRSGGRLAVEQYPNSALGGEVEMLKALQLGTLDLAFITGAPLPNVVPEVGAFNIPFIFRDLDHAHSVLDGPIGQDYLGKFVSKDLVALAWGENGMRHLTNSKREIRTPEDLKGLKLRLPQSEVMLVGFKALGADPALLPFPQVFGALQSGQFDGQENPIATIMSAKFAQVQKYLTLTGHVYDPAVFLASPDTFTELQDEDKKTLTEAARAGAQASRKYAAEAQQKGVAALRQAGMTVTTEVDRSLFSKAMASAVPEYEKRFGADVMQRIRQTGAGL